MNTTIQECVGKEISSIELKSDYFNDDCIEIKFVDQTTLAIRDNAQQCCEERYLTLDDDTTPLIGAKFLGVSEKSFSDSEDKHDVHEELFVDIETSKGCVTFCTHNVHNGYYGGFNLTAKIA